jgi:hypothetical protein
LETAAKVVPQRLKAAYIRRIYGTAEAVPFVQRESFPQPVKALGRAFLPYQTFSVAIEWATMPDAKLSISHKTEEF